MFVIFLLFIGSVSCSSFWNYKGCYPISDLVLNYLFGRNIVDYEGNIFRISWAQCASLMYTEPNITMVGILKDGHCYACNNCIMPTYKVRGYCPDYGSHDRIQLFTIESDRSLIPEQYKECSSGNYSCKGIHPLSYRSHDAIQWPSTPELNLVKFKSLLPSSCTSLNTNCTRVFQDYRTYYSQSLVWPPNLLMPLSFNQTYDSRVSMFQSVLMDANEKWNNNTYIILNKTVLEEARLTREPTLFPYLLQIFPAMIGHIQKKVGVVIGCPSPWIEANLLRIGAAHVITVEYKPILSLVPDISVVTPLQLASRYLGGNWSPVDFAFSFSSVEHSGLGRYGDPVDGEGDLRAMRQISCLLKPGGVLFLSVPTGPDALVYNLHRIYGRYRIPALLEGWELLEVLGDVMDVEDAPGVTNYSLAILVLRKPEK